MDQIQFILRNPGRGRRMSEQQQAAVKAFVDVFEPDLYHRDMEEAAGVLLGIIVLLTKKHNRSIPMQNIFEFVARRAADIFRNCGGV